MTDIRGKYERRALIIDDTEVIRALLTEALEKKGYVVSTASDASEGIALTTQIRPELIFCDTYMPDLDGFQTIRSIRKITPDAIVVLTNSLPDARTSPSGQSKVYDYLLNKPFGLDELWSILDDVRERLDARMDESTKQERKKPGKS